jgi:hypothetical protein
MWMLNNLLWILWTHTTRNIYRTLTIRQTNLTAVTKYAHTTVTNRLNVLARNEMVHTVWCIATLWVGVIMLWHVYTLLGGDWEIGDRTVAVARQRPLNSSRGMVFSVQSVSRCISRASLKLSQSVELSELVGEWVSEWVRELLQFRPC